MKTRHPIAEHIENADICLWSAQRAAAAQKLIAPTTVLHLMGPSYRALGAVKRAKSLAARWYMMVAIVHLRSLSSQL